MVRPPLILQMGEERVGWGRVPVSATKVVFQREDCHTPFMRTERALDDKLTEAGDGPDRGYAAWKRAKIEAALAQAANRDAMIPIETVLRDLGVER
jgi:hypothetical protein